jgi:hypothetical protein
LWLVLLQLDPLLKALFQSLAGCGRREAQQSCVGCAAAHMLLMVLTGAREHYATLM